MDLKLHGVTRKGPRPNILQITINCHPIQQLSKRKCGPLTMDMTIQMAWL